MTRLTKLALALLGVAAVGGVVSGARSASPGRNGKIAFQSGRTGEYNIFVMALIFAQLRIPAKYQHRVLFWGIVGAIAMRGMMIGIGSALVHFKWVLWAMGAFLVFIGVRMAVGKDEEDTALAERKVYLLARRVLPERADREPRGEERRTAPGAVSRLHAAPDGAPAVVAEHVDAVERRDAVAAVAIAPRDGAPFAVRVLQDGRREARRGAAGDDC